MERKERRSALRRECWRTPNSHTFTETKVLQLCWRTQVHEQPCVDTINTILCLF
ncbi:hypothetical protein OIU76_009862 [Salix suchowensis]|nr:hypothetical protein OIU76_009862 [Salix suchowensis]